MDRQPRDCLGYQNVVVNYGLAQVARRRQVDELGHVYHIFGRWWNVQASYVRLASLTSFGLHVRTESTPRVQTFF